MRERGQNMSQITCNMPEYMSHRMPGAMSDRLSRYMSDKMTDGGYHSKK